MGYNHNFKMGRKMNLYEYWDKEKIRQVVADCHVDEFEFYMAAKKAFNVEIEPGSIKQKWCQPRLKTRNYHTEKVHGSYPVTIGDVKQ